MLKKIMWGMVGGLLVSQLHAGSLDLGSKTIQFQADIDFDTPFGTQFASDFGVGKLFKKNQEIGAQVGFENNDVISVFNAGAYGQLYFPQTPSFAPYVGGGLGVNSTSIDYLGEDDSKAALVFSLNGGGLVFITPQLAVDGKFNFRLATDDVYLGEDDTESTDFRLLFGLKYFWGATNQSSLPRKSTIKK